jgi:hypothetical protein
MAYAWLGVTYVTTTQVKIIFIIKNLTKMTIRSHQKNIARARIECQIWQGWRSRSNSVNNCTDWCKKYNLVRLEEEIYGDEPYSVHASIAKVIPMLWHYMVDHSKCQMLQPGTLDQRLSTVVSSERSAQPTTIVSNAASIYAAPHNGACRQGTKELSS